MIYAAHNGIRTDFKMFDPEWLELFQEQQELACRNYGRGAAFVVEATHEGERSYEMTPARIAWRDLLDVARDR